MQEVNTKEFISFFDSLNVGVLIHKEKILYANDYLLKLYNVESFEDVRNKDPIDFVFDEYKEAFQINSKAIMEGKSLPPIIEKTHDSQGNDLWVEMVLSNVLFNGEKAILVFIKSVNERVQREEKLSQVYKLELIKDFSVLLKKKNSLKEIGKRTYEYCHENEIADYLYIASVKEDNIFIEWSHLEYAEILHQELPRSQKKGILWYIVDTGKELYLPNAFDFEIGDYKLVHLSSLSREIPVSYFGVPIKEGERVRMVVSFLKKGYGAFSEIDFTFFKVVAAQIEVATQFNVITKELEREREKFRELAMEDALTGVYTRHFFNEWIQNYYEIIRRKNEYASIVMIDVDHFKKINDNYGHLVGDKVLRAVGNVLKSSTRRMDLVVRYGGDEFLMVFPQTTQKRVDEILKRIQSKLSSLKKEFGFEISLSYGIAYISPEKDYKQALQSADEKMYEMKNSK